MDVLDDESARTPQIHNKYNKELSEAKKMLIKYEGELNTLIKEKWVYYSGKADKKVYIDKPLDLKILKTDVRMFVDGDSDIVHMRQYIAFVKNKIEYIEKVISECNRRSFHISNIVNFQKFKHGDV